MKLKYPLLILYFALLLVPAKSIAPIAGLGIDASSHQALALALQKNMIFGKDFIFNYGPLGFLNNGFLPEIVHVGAQFLFDLYILVNLLFIINYALKRAKITWLAVLILTSMIVPWGAIADTTFTLLFIFIFNIFHANENRRSFSLYNALFIASLMFFIKVNFSLVISILFYVSLIYLFFTNRFSWREIIAVILVHISLIWWGASKLNVDVKNYLLSNLQIIQSFDDAHSNIAVNPFTFYSILFIVGSITVFTLIVFFKNVTQIYKRHDFLFNFLMIFTAMYLSFKQQFIDFTATNAMGFFLFIPPLMALLWIFLRDTDKWFSRLTFYTTIVSIIAFQILRFSKTEKISDYIGGYYQAEEAYFKYKYDGITLRNFTNYKLEYVNDLTHVFLMHTPYAYFKSLTNNSFTPIFPKYNIANRKLPSEILTKINGKSIDILPNEISYIFFNKINYNPRPTIQSQIAANKFLDEKNFSHYNSNNGPDYLLYKFEENNFWEETNTKKSILANYKLTNTCIIPQLNAKGKLDGNDTLLLLQKQKLKKEISLKLLDQKNATIGENIAIPTSKNLIILKVKFKYTTLGKMYRFIFQAPLIICKLKYSDGSLKIRKGIIPILDEGIIANIDIKNTNQLIDFFNDSNTPSQKIDKIKFTTNLAWAFEDKLKINIEETIIK